MGKFIVIKAEDWEKLKSASKHGLHSLPNIPIIELSTDESIEDSAEKAIYNEINKGNYELSAFEGGYTQDCYRFMFISERNKDLKITVSSKEKYRINKQIVEI